MITLLGGSEGHWFCVNNVNVHTVMCAFLGEIFVGFEQKDERTI